MQVDIGNNKILDTYRTIVTSPDLQALHHSFEGDRVSGDPHPVLHRFSSSSARSDERESAEVHSRRRHHRGHQSRSHQAQSQSPSSANSPSRQLEGISSPPDSTIYRTPISSRRSHRSAYVVPAPAHIADSSAVLGLPPTPPTQSAAAHYSGAPSGLPRRAAQGDNVYRVPGERVSGAPAGNTPTPVSQRRSSSGRKRESSHHRVSSQHADGASDQQEVRKQTMESKERQAAAAAEEPAGGAKPKPKLAQTSVQPGMQLKHWVVVNRIGAGSFGETFGAVEVDWAAPPPSEEGCLVISPEAAALLENLPPPDQRAEVCIKVEQENKNVLRLEALALKKVQPCKQVVRYLGSGCTCGMNFLVMEKLGSNLAELRRRSPHGTFNIYTTLRAGISCLSAIREVHAQGLIHRDIKPSNFVTGLAGGPNWSVCYLIDFGLARRFMRSSGEIRPPRDSAGFRGTSRYASVASHMHLELGRVDDLWSLLFMLVEFATGTLPWRKYKDKEDIGRCKEESIGPHLVRNLPREFQPFLAHLQTLRYEDEPDYDYLLSLMEKAIERRGYPPGKPVDWELDAVTMEAVAAQEEQAARLPQPQRAEAAAAVEAAGHASGMSKSQAAAAAVSPAGPSHYGGVEYVQQPVSKRERGGSRASSSQAAEDAMSPSRAANPSRVSVSEVELGYERRRDGTARGRESYVDEPAISIGQQRVQGSEEKDYSSSSEGNFNKNKVASSDFSPREIAQSKGNRSDDRGHVPASASCGNDNRQVDVDVVSISAEAARANEDADAQQQNQSASPANAQPVSAGATPQAPPKKIKHKSKCNCVIM